LVIKKPGYALAFVVHKSVVPWYNSFEILKQSVIPLNLNLVEAKKRLCTQELKWDAMKRE
jgi:hypothetical protein